jgi:H+/gluconate symporter-like permease
MAFLGILVALARAAARAGRRPGRRHAFGPTLLHRVASMPSGTLDILPRNGAVMTLLALCGATHGESYVDIVLLGIVGP